MCEKSAFSIEWHECQKSYFAEPKNHDRLRRFATSTVTLIEYYADKRKTDELRAMCDSFLEIVSENVDSDEPLSALAGELFISIGELLKQKGLTAEAISCYKAALNILAVYQKKNCADNTSLQFCISAHHYSQLCEMNGDHTTAFELAGIAIENSQNKFRDDANGDTASAERIKLASVFATEKDETPETNRLFVKESLRLVYQSQPRSYGSELTMGTATVVYLVGDERDKQQALERIVGRFELIEQLGMGGMGVVYKARDKMLDRIVALKILRSSEARIDNQILLAEARMLARFTHPNIVPIYDIGEDNGVVFIVMKLIDGPNLKDFHTKNQDLRKTASVLRDIAHALGAAHESNVLHLDVKPTNILLDRKQTPYLIDFGVSAFVTGEQDSQKIAGTPSFMSPEMARQEKTKFDGRTDIFSMGATMFDCFTGEPWIKWQVNQKDLFELIIDSDFPIDKLRDANVPKDLQSIIIKCMEKEVSHRYKSCDELADDLERFLKGKLVKSRNYTYVEILWRHILGNRISISLGTILFFALVVGIFAGLPFTIPLSIAMLMLLAFLAGPLLEQLAQLQAFGKPREVRARGKRQDQKTINEPVFSSEMVVTHYPLPIALPYRRFCSRENYRERLDGLYFTLEAMLRYLTYLGLADLGACYVRYPPKNRAFPESQQFEFLRRRKNMQLGMWAGALREITRELKGMNSQKRSFIPELLEVCGPGSYFDETILTTLISKRNTRLVHRQGLVSLSEAEAKELFIEVRTLLEDGLKRIEFVRHYPLGFATQAALPMRAPKNMRFRIHSCMGATIREAYVKEFKFSFKTQTPFIVSRDFDKVLYLWPWILEFESEKTGRDSLYAFESIISDRSQFLTEIKVASPEVEDVREVTLSELPAGNHHWLFSVLKELPVKMYVGLDENLYELLLPSRPTQLIGKRLGPYSVEQLLAVGSFATVYLAKSDLDKPVALKVIEARDGIRQMDRFCAEFDKLKAAGNHPSILTCFETDIEIIDGREYPWYSMEYAIGGDLFSRMLERRAKHSFPWTDKHMRKSVIREFITLCEAVAHLHKLDIVHRDLKPSNVLIMHDGTLRLSDFGLVKNLRPTQQSLMKRHATSTGAVLGTPFYMSPEQEQGEVISKRSDVYSLGIILAELLTGELPKPAISNQGGSRIAQAAKIRDLPKPLTKLILRMTDVDPMKRQEDAKMVLHESKWLNGM